MGDSPLVGEAGWGCNQPVLDPRRLREELSSEDAVGENWGRGWRMLRVTGRLCWAATAPGITCNFRAQREKLMRQRCNQGGDGVDEAPVVPPVSAEAVISRPKSCPRQAQVVPAAASPAAVPGHYSREPASPEITAWPQTSIPLSPVWHRCQVRVGARGFLKGFCLILLLQFGEETTDSSRGAACCLLGHLLAPDSKDVEGFLIFICKRGGEGRV